MGIIILGIAVAVRKQFALPNKSEWGYFALLGFLAITFHQWLKSNALQTSEASTTAWIVATTPVFMALLGWVILKEKLALAKIIGIVLAAVGVLLVVSDGNITSSAIGRFGAPGDILILISALNWAIISVLSRRGLKSYSASLMIFYVMSFGWMGITFLGIFCSGLAYLACYDALQALSTAETGVFLYIEPLVAVVVAFFILGEAITGASMAGGTVILLGVWMMNKKKSSIYCFM